ncbi:MAG: T9SS type A sorting domain-containing protein [Balneolaceae bacterium]
MKKATKLSLLTFLVVVLGINLSHAQISYSGNSESGFGGTIGGSTLSLSTDGTTITGTLTKGAGDFNDTFVIYISNGNSGRSTIGTEVNDRADANRAAISYMEAGTGKILTFPSGFEATHAIAINTGFGGLWSIPNSGSIANNGLTFVTGLGGDGKPSSSTDASFTFSFDFSDIGLNDNGGNGFSFVATYLNPWGGDSNLGFASNEGFGSGFPGSNIGQENVTLTGFESYARVYISGSAGWRLLSLPKTGGTVEDISDDTAIQGITGGDNALTDANFYIYDSNGDFDEPTNVSTAWGDGLGFAVYFYNNTTAGSSTLPITLGVSGAEPASDVVVDLYSGATGRYTLVGNPFASNVDLANVGANIAISSNMTFWDNTAGSYTTENISGGLVIQPWQGYWVQTSASTGGGQLTYGTADKTSSAADTTHFDKASPTALKELKFTIESSYNTENNLTLQVANDATEGWDSYDLLKLGSLLPQHVSAAFMGSLEGESVLKGIESIPFSLEREITLPIMVDLVGESQTLKMNWEGVSALPESWSITFHDYEAEESFDLRSASSYDFDVIVKGSNEKVNPLTILSSPLGQKMKLKSDQTARFGITITPSTTSVTNEPGTEIKGFALEQNYPNPFNPTTTINYSVENSGAVSLSVYNLMGQKVAELVNETKSAGSYNVTWNASQAASGMYYYRLEAGGQVLTRKMTLIK